MTRAPAGSPTPVGRFWRDGDDPGGRRWAALDTALRLESGVLLPGVRLAYETWGTLNADRSNAVLVLHGLTGDSHVVGPAGTGHPTPGWWEGLVGPGRPLDTDRRFIVAPNALGGCQGSTGPSSPGPDGKPWGARFPRITVRDHVAAESRLADALGIDVWAAVLGGSMGGMRALEWAVGLPDRVDALLALSCPAASSAQQIAWASTQLHAIRADPHWHGGDYHRHSTSPDAGLGVARRIAHTTYRGEGELAERFGRRPQAGEEPGRGGRFAIESYLDHQADKLLRRFDAGSYVVLVESKNSHDVGRDRGGIDAALCRITARTLVAGVDTDALYPVAQQRALAEGIPGAALRLIRSPYGHDGFLVETEQVGGLVRDLLGEPC
ncbi:homoserine O-acetyltransferase MetX [Actinoalloteichus sp. GBA129-24]|uniref:homoserine O-acetyltransferase MetX n=1 Tax=Actinoalloteichus sp. GBA129-24 TaxID=1612551 RepID=UPI00095073CC|nr:homoserine O-acetyltransferase [Actinoalloteichus sp. GBA129-24]APU22727.1 homoserine O-acetyltransferase [Actinoalloteichus sp. GBA129-24]